MIQVFIYDENGFYIDSKFTEELGENMTVKPILIGRVKPKFDKEADEWVEGATEEEIKEWEANQPKPQPSETEKLKQELLTVQEALDFILFKQGVI